MASPFFLQRHTAAVSLYGRREAMASSTGKNMARISVPVLREVVERLGSEKGVVLVGECYDLVTGALMDAFASAKLPVWVKAAAEGPMKMVTEAGRAAVIDWAKKQVSAAAQGS